MKPIRVLIVEDSGMQRKALHRYLAEAETLEVVGEAGDGAAGVEAVKSLSPDVVLMDVHMPLLDGLEATQQIMGECPTPILLMTAQDNLEKQVDLGLRALEAGALDLIPKPDLQTLREHGSSLVARLTLLAGVPVIAHMHGTRRARRARSTRSTGYYRRASRVCGIVASTGGPRALQTVLAGFPDRLKSAVVIVQHLDGAFMDGLVRWLDRLCPLPVHLANDGQELVEGVVYVCPAGRYAEVTDGRCLSLVKEPVPTGGHCPSGDRLLTSIAAAYGQRATGVVLTGMGDDGAAGLLAIKDVQGTTIAQDEETSVIYGMPKEATENGAAARVLPLEKIAAAIAQASK